MCEQKRTRMETGFLNSAQKLFPTYNPVSSQNDNLESRSNKYISMAFIIFLFL